MGVSVSHTPVKFVVDISYSPELLSVSEVRSMQLELGETVFYGGEAYTVIWRDESKGMDDVEVQLHMEREDGQLIAGFKPITVREEEFSI